MSPAVGVWPAANSPMVMQVVYDSLKAILIKQNIHSSDSPPFNTPVRNSHHFNRVSQQFPMECFSGVISRVSSRIILPI